MLFISGAAGSGKTSLLLDRLREAIRRKDTGVRLLVPTATLARHMQNRLAREGFVFPRHMVQTLSRFLDPFVPNLSQAQQPVLYLIVEEAVARVNRPEFARVAGLAGFSASLARTIEEFSSAGCDSARLEKHLPDTPLGDAFLAIYREVDRELAERGMAMRAGRLEAAARAIEAQGAGDARTILLDGFHALPDPELEVVRSLSHHCEVTLTLATGEATTGTRARLFALGAVEHPLPSRRGAPALLVVKAPSLEREADEIARRILDQHSAGRPFREIGIVVRAASTYVPLLRATLERFGIPARFYFDTNLDEQPAVRFLSGAVEAMLGGWDHEATLSVLRMAPRFANSGVADLFDFAVREQLPNAGLGALRGLVPQGAERLTRLIDDLGAVEEWQALVLDPKDWAARFRTLRNLFRIPRPPTAITHELALMWRTQSTALDLFDQSLDHAAAALKGRGRIALAEFWRAAKAVLRLEPVRLEDERRNVVHVLSAHEARQWSLPVVFVCGMTERQFPGFHPQDPFFPDAARTRLRDQGIRVRNAREWEIEERALFDSAITRATMMCALSYPEFDARGERNLPSLFLEDLDVTRESARPVRPRPRSSPRSPAPAAIHDPRLIDVLGHATEALSPTSLESFLQCPFQFFANKTLRLKGAPERPADRLNPLLQGGIVHEVLKEWWTHPQPVEPLLDRIFNLHCEQEGVPQGYRSQRVRDAMLADVIAFTQDPRWPRDAVQSRTEEEFRFELDEGIDIRGKIDRLDIDAAGRAWVIDYKYSGKQTTRDKLGKPDLLQAPLYFMAAERHFNLRPAGMFYIGLRGSVEYCGWSNIDEAPVKAEAMGADWTSNARRATLVAVEEIRSGRIVPNPSDIDRCRWCDFADACRFDAEAAQSLGESA
jgi:ATP-dependent helicase/DNAse subunit B